MTVTRTGGVWDPADRHVYFLAGDPSGRWEIPHGYILKAVNEMCDPQGNVRDKVRERCNAALDNGARLLIDSGIFWLTNEHMRAHGITMDEALALPPDQIDNFDWLWTSYINVVNEYGAAAWGFIELDQGGAVNKRKTREKLNDLGIYPMPVYHPLNDGWEYFDELASTHDRMCCGNIVQASSGVRKRLIHTLAERHREYPDLWVHLLGYTPGEWVNAFDVDSADSSTWLTAIRWDAPRDECAMRWFSKLPRHFQYRLASEATAEHGHVKGEDLSCAIAAFAQRNWRQANARTKELLG